MCACLHGHIMDRTRDLSGKTVLIKSTYGNLKKSNYEAWLQSDVEVANQERFGKGKQLNKILETQNSSSVFGI